MQIFNKWRKENSGLTFIELICAIAIFSLVGATICSVMIVSAKNYKKDTNEIELQQDAQLTANQLQDILIDAENVNFIASGMVAKLTVYKGDCEYTVLYQSALGELKYSEKIVSTNVLVADKELMAENVTTFSVDLTNYATTRDLTLKLGLTKDDKSYESSYTVSSRNQIPSVSSGVPTPVTLTTQDELVLEPNESMYLVATLAGTSDKAVSWSMTGNSSGGTKVYPEGEKWKIQIGNDEQSSELILTVKSNVKQADGVTPAADQQVTVHVRRVMAITFDASAPILQSGTAKQAGAIYRLDVTVTGNNLNQYGLSVTDTDMNYVDPRQVEWVFIINGTAISNSNEYVEKIEGNNNYIRIKLKKDLELGVHLSIKAIARHPQGTNKTFIPYGDIYDIYTFIPDYYHFIGGLVYRGTDDEQGEIFEDKLKNLVIAKEGNGSYYIYKEYRIREVLSESPAGRTCGEWSNWSNMIIEGGNKINIRPDETYRFDYKKDYEIQIRFFVYKDSKSNIVWPFSDTPTDANLIDAEIKRLKIYFDSSQLGLNIASTCGSKDAPCIVNCNNNVDITLHKQSWYEMGFNFTKAKEGRCFMFKVEKLYNDAWIAANLNSDFSEDLQDYTKAQNIKFLNPGTYRVIVGLKDVPYREYNEATQTGTTVYRDYWLGNEATGDCIFYIRAQ